MVEVQISCLSIVCLSAGVDNDDHIGSRSSLHWQFWTSIFKVLGTQLNMSTTDHSQNDGQNERINRFIGVVLRSVFATPPKTWSSMLPVVDFR